MDITLRIENRDSLPTGGPLEFSRTNCGFQIGRGGGMDWVLPDDNRYVSSTHCEVRFEGEQFILYDKSTNGTFVNSMSHRLDRPHVLQSGDRLHIGDYIVVASIDAGVRARGGQALVGEPQFRPADRQSKPMAPSPQSGLGPPAFQGGAEQMHVSAPAAPTPPLPSAAPVWPSGPELSGGRHSPIPSGPGVGTPADSVWSTGQHAPGTQDPSIYNGGYDPLRGNPPNFSTDPLDRAVELPRLVPEAPLPSRGIEPSAPLPEPAYRPAPPQSAPSAGAAAVMSDASSEAAAMSSPWQAAAGGGGQAFPGPQAPPATPPVPPAPFPLGNIGPAQGHGPGHEHGPEASSGPSLNPGRAPAAAPAALGAAPSAILNAFAAGAQIKPDAVAGRDPEAFAGELGALLRDVTGDVMALLKARSEVKAMTRNAKFTMVSRRDNNALKFCPTPEIALHTMLAADAGENGYLPLRASMTDALTDIQKHHVWTYSAMQRAAAHFEAALSPRSVDVESTPAKSAFTNNKARSWEILTERWDAIERTHEHGAVGLFTKYFTTSYEELSAIDYNQQREGHG